MALPTVSVVAPVLRVPHVSAETLTVELTATGRPAPLAFGFRMYDIGEPPPAYREKETATVDPTVTEYFTQGGLVRSTNYLIQSYARNLDGTVYTSDIVVPWFPEENLYPPPDAYFGSGSRPWSWEDYRTNWLATLPAYYEDEPFLSALLGSVSDEFQRFAAAVEQVERYSLPSRTYGVGLSQWERLLGIRPPASLSEDRRRAILLAHLRGRLDASAHLFAESLTTIVGAAPRIRENFPAFQVTIDTRDDPDLTELVAEIVARIMPAHLIPVFGSAVKKFDYPTRRLPLVGLWPRGRATTRPDNVTVGGFDLGGFS